MTSHHRRQLAAYRTHRWRVWIRDWRHPLLLLNCRQGAPIGRTFGFGCLLGSATFRSRLALNHTFRGSTALRVAPIMTSQLQRRGRGRTRPTCSTCRSATRWWMPRVRWASLWARTWSGPPPMHRQPPPTGHPCSVALPTRSCGTAPPSSRVGSRAARATSMMRSSAVGSGERSVLSSVFGSRHYQEVFGVSGLVGGSD